MITPRRTRPKPINVIVKMGLPSGKSPSGAIRIHLINGQDARWPHRVRAGLAYDAYATVSFAAMRLALPVERGRRFLLQVLRSQPEKH